MPVTLARKRRCGRGARGRKEGAVFWTRDNGFRRDALESQQTAADGMARGCVGMTGDAARFAGKPAGACIAAKNRALEHARRFPHGEMRRRNRSAAWFRPAANGFRGCGCRGKPSGARRRTRRHSLSERCVLSRSIARGDNANISAGAAGLPAERLVKAPRPTDVQARLRAKDAARQAEQSAV